jgi:capsular exopolysaccharide synthesis family protein
MGEGKTLTALNLAWLLAQSEGVKALVIDSDLRQPCATEYLAIDAPRGLSEVLGGELRLRDAIVRLDPAGLYLLPGGQARDDVAELLSGPTFAGVIAEARRLFDFIIIDAPPLGIFTDANVLISRADGALLVVRAGKTRYAMVDKLLEQLPRERMLGVVLNRADEELESGAYYYQQRHYRPQRLSAGEERLRLVSETDEEEVAIAS